MPDERDALDAELAEALGPSNPDAMFDLGKAVPHADTAVEALSALHPSAPHPAEYEDFNVRHQRFSGVSITNLEELDALLSEQEAVLPMHRNADRLRWTKDLPKILDRFWWADLSHYERHPLKPSFRNITGQGEPWSEREAPVTAFLRVLSTLSAPDWVEAIVFADTPYMKSWPPPRPPAKDIMPDTKGVTEHRPRLPITPITMPPIEVPHTRWRIAYLRQNLDWAPQIPDWLKSFVFDAQQEP